VPIEAFVPYDKGELLNDIHKVGMVEKTVSDLFDHLKSSNSQVKYRYFYSELCPNSLKVSSTTFIVMAMQ
jgi:hypothetical protein